MITECIFTTEKKNKCSTVTMLHTATCKGTRWLSIQISILRSTNDSKVYVNGDGVGRSQGTEIVTYMSRNEVVERLARKWREYGDEISRNNVATFCKQIVQRCNATALHCSAIEMLQYRPIAYSIAYNSLSAALSVTKNEWKRPKYKHHNCKRVDLDNQRL